VVLLRETVPARTVIRGNSGDSACFEMNDAHEGDPLATKYMAARRVDISPKRGANGQSMT
jgi:hypothetical protein